MAGHMYNGREIELLIPASSLEVLKIAVIPVGLVVSMIAFVCIMALLGNATLLGPNLAVAILSAMYSMIAYIIIVVIESKISL